MTHALITGHDAIVLLGALAALWGCRIVLDEWLCGRSTRRARLETHLSEFVDVQVSWVGEELAEEAEVWLAQA